MTVIGVDQAAAGGERVGPWRRERTLRLVGGRGDAVAADEPQRVQPAYRSPALSQREVEVLLAWFRSDSKAQAAEELFISVGTLNTHLSRVRAKYSKVERTASTKAALVVRALQDGLVTLDEW